MQQVPPAITELITDWEARGCPPQTPVAWSLDKWTERRDKSKYTNLARYRHVLENLPEPISRADVRSLAEHAHHDEDAAVSTFIAAMVWGGGNTDHRVPGWTDKIFSNVEDLPGRLMAIASDVRSHGPVEGYRSLMIGNKIAGLAQSYGTKYLSFCSQPETPALILDVVVNNWLRAHCQFELPEPPAWSVESYGRYVEAMVAWADGRCSPDDLETLVFQAGQGR